MFITHFNTIEIMLKKMQIILRAFSMEVNENLPSRIKSMEKPFCLEKAHLSQERIDFKSYISVLSKTPTPVLMPYF